MAKPKRRKSPSKSAPTKRAQRPVKPPSARRRRFLADQEAKAYARRVRYAMGRDKPIPEPRTKTLARLRDKEIVEFAERNPPQLRAKRKKSGKYYRERKKLEKKYHVTNRRTKKGRITDRIYNIPFQRDSSPNDEGEDETSRGITINRKAIREVFSTESQFDQPRRPRICRGYMKAKFKDTKKSFWFALAKPRLAQDGADNMADDFESAAQRYAIQSVREIEVVVTYIADEK